MIDIIAAQQLRRRRLQNRLPGRIPKYLPVQADLNVVKVRKDPAILLRKAIPRLVAAAALFALVLLAGWALKSLPDLFRFNAAGLPAGSDGLNQRAMSAYAGIPVPGTTPVLSGDDIPLDLTETFSWEKYTVKNGDSVSAIAQARSLSLDTIIALNRIGNVKKLTVGTVIRIPNMDGIPYTVRKGDSLSRISADSGIPMDAILDANDLDSDKLSVGATLFLPGARMRTDELKKALGELFIHPLRGRLTSGYGWRNDPFTGVRRFHAAVDWAAPVSTPVKASLDGRVSTRGFSGVYGNYIVLSHDGGYQTLYAHLNSFSVAKGERVNQGGRIGTVGSTGYSTGPHLHFAVFKNGRALNPLEFLQK